MGVARRFLSLPDEMVDRSSLLSSYKGRNERILLN